MHDKETDVDLQKSRKTGTVAGPRAVSSLIVDEIAESLFSKIVDLLILDECFSTHRELVRFRRLRPDIVDPSITVEAYVPPQRDRTKPPCEYGAVCPICAHVTFANRFAAHLEKCFGIGGRTLRRGFPNYNESITNISGDASGTHSPFLGSSDDDNSKKNRSSDEEEWGPGRKKRKKKGATKPRTTNANARTTTATQNAPSRATGRAQNGSAARVATPQQITSATGRASESAPTTPRGGGTSTSGPSTPRGGLTPTGTPRSGTPRGASTSAAASPVTSRGGRGRKRTR